MDERTRRTDDDLAPNLRRTAPDPVVTAQPYSKLRIGLGIVVALGVIVAAYEIVHYARAPQPTNPTLWHGRRAAVGRRGDHRHRQYPRHRQRARHRHAARHRHGADPDQRPIDRRRTSPKASSFSKGDFLAQIDRPPLRDPQSPIRRPARARSGPAGAGAKRPDALSDAVGAEVDRRASRPRIRSSSSSNTRAR